MELRDNTARWSQRQSKSCMAISAASEADGVDLDLPFHLRLGRVAGDGGGALDRPRRCVRLFYQMYVCLSLRSSLPDLGLVGLVRVRVNIRFGSKLGLELGLGLWLGVGLGLRLGLG